MTRLAVAFVIGIPVMWLCWLRNIIQFAKVLLQHSTRWPNLSSQRKTRLENLTIGRLLTGFSDREDIKVYIKVVSRLNQRK